MDTKELSLKQKAELEYLGAVLPELADVEEAVGAEQVTPQKSLQLLTEVFEKQILATKTPIVFKMSGGLDSRLLAFILKEIWHASLEVHMVCHPTLTEEEDVDVVLAKKALEFLDIQHSLVVQKTEPDKYLYPFNDESVQVTGIYGTEVFGGLMFDVLPVVDRLKGKVLGEYINTVDPEFREHIENVLLKYIIPKNTSFFCKVFTESPKSTIYGSVEHGWSQPSLFNEFCIAPFGNPKLVEQIKTLSSGQLAGYEFYDKVFKLLPQKYQEIPLCSDYKRFKQHPFPIPSGLRNAKEC